MDPTQESWDLVARQLLDLLDEAVRGASGPATYFVDNRPDSGLLGCVMTLDSNEASTEIAGTSIAAHVHHTAFAMGASADWIGGCRRVPDWGASWTVVGVDDAGWEALLLEFEAQYGRLREAIGSRSLDDRDSFAEAVGAIAHVGYHLGSVWQKRAFMRASAGRVEPHSAEPQP